jgi:nucleoside-diphosphate-sugar epimerase
MKRVLVTGASGFVGRSITKRLLSAGYQIRAQYRRESPPDGLVEASREGADLVRCDLVRLTAENRLGTLLEDVWGVVHCAARVSQTGPKSLFETINIDVTKALLESAAAFGCRRFLYIGSMAVHGFGNHFESGEDGPYFRLSSHYQRTKKIAENIVIASRYKSLSTTVLRAGLVYGPGVSTVLKIVMELIAMHKLPMIGGFGVYNCFVYVEDFAEAVSLALASNGAEGEIFNITGDGQVTVKEAAVGAAKLMGKPPPRINIPAWTALSAGIVVDRIYALFRLRGEPMISRYLAEQLRSDFHFSSAKAKRLIGYAPQVDWENGLEQTVAAFMKANPALFD